MGLIKEETIEILCYFESDNTYSFIHTIKDPNKKFIEITHYTKFEIVTFHNYELALAFEEWKKENYNNPEKYIRDPMKSFKTYL